MGNPDWARKGEGELMGSGGTPAVQAPWASLGHTPCWVCKLAQVFRGVCACTIVGKRVMEFA